MVYYTYARGPEHTDADYTTGEPDTGVHLEVWTAATSGTQITALKTLAGSALPGYVTVDAFGRYEFRIESQANPAVWMKDPSGKFWQILASEVLPLVPAAIADVASAAADAAAAAADASDAAADAAAAAASAASVDVDHSEYVFKPEGFGAVGDGVANDTAAVAAAFAAANALLRPGLTGTIWHPGATVVLAGQYKLTTLAAAINVNCNVRGANAIVTAPSAYASSVFLVGHQTSGSILQGADIVMPDVLSGNTAGPLTASSVGIKVQNLWSSRLKLGRVAYFETGVWFTGLGNGTVENEINLGWISYAKVSVKLAPGTAGWVNQNTFIGGGIQQSASFDGSTYRRSGWKHLQLDGGGINFITGNTFLGFSFEGDVSAIAIDIRQAYQNTFYGCRSEPGRAGRTVSTTAASTSIALTAHGLAVNDMVVFAGTLPAALNINVPYFVISVADADHFTVSSAKGGTALTIATTTSTGLVYQPHRVNVDASTYSSQEIHFIDTAAILKTLEIVTSGSVEGITQDYHNQRTMDAYQDADRPLLRLRNRYSSGVSRPAVATYAPAVVPADDPNNWTTALSDRGLLFGESRAEIGRMWGASGTIFYRVPADSASYEIASCKRLPSLVTITSLSCAANTTTSTTFTLTGASVRDHIVVTPDGTLGAGLILSDVRCSSTNTITIVFGNLTGSTIVLTQSFNAIAIRRFL